MSEERERVAEELRRIRDAVREQALLAPAQLPTARSVRAAEPPAPPEQVTPEPALQAGDYQKALGEWTPLAERGAIDARPDATPVGHNREDTPPTGEHPPNLFQQRAELFAELDRMDEENPVDGVVAKGQFPLIGQRDPTPDQQ
jgi:hypothetical protein